MEKEKILFGLNTPLKINLVEITDTYKEWHKELKIIYFKDYISKAAICCIRRINKAAENQEGDKPLDFPLQSYCFLYNLSF